MTNDITTSVLSHMIYERQYGNELGNTFTSMYYIITTLIAVVINTY